MTKSITSAKYIFENKSQLCRTQLYGLLLPTYLQQGSTFHSKLILLLKLDLRTNQNYRENQHSTLNELVIRVLYNQIKIKIVVDNGTIIECVAFMFHFDNSISGSFIQMSTFGSVMLKLRDIFPIFSEYLEMNLKEFLKCQTQSEPLISQI